MIRTFPALVPIALLATAGCGMDGGPNAGVSVRDSAGVTIVENGPDRLADAPEWAVSAEPSLEIVSDEGAGPVLFRIEDVAWLPDGRIAVANGGSDEVLLFDPTGALQARIGHTGDGPGEFRSVSSIAPVPGDSIAAYDNEHRRLSVFDADGSLGHVVGLADAVESFSGARVLPLHGAGLVFFTSGLIRRDAPDGEPYRPESESIRIATDGARLASYGLVPGPTLMAVSTGPFGGLVGPALFGTTSFAATLDDALLLGTAESTEVRLYGPSGALSRIVRWPDHDRETTEAHFLRLVDLMVTASPPGQMPPDPEEFFRQIPRAAALPAYQDLLAWEGGFWVGAYVVAPPPTWEFPRPSRRWLIFDAEGVVVGSIRTPEGFQPTALRTGEALGVYTDPLGIESVRVHVVAGPGAE